MGGHERLEKESQTDKQIVTDEKETEKKDKRERERETRKKWRQERETRKR